jgi:hypothetical protein
MNGYAEEGFDEWAEAEIAKYPVWSEIILMEDELGIPNLEINALEAEGERARAYYHKLKAMIEEKPRRSA